MLFDGNYTVAIRRTTLGRLSITRRINRIDLPDLKPEAEKAQTCTAIKL
jgi:hypothetical protein